MNDRGAEANHPLRLAMITQVLVRMELDHVEEWLRHLAMLGFDRCYVYYDRLVVDVRCGQADAEPTWKKKPEADFHLELDDDEALERFEAIVRSVDGIEVFLRPSTSRAETSGKRQVEHLTELLLELSGSSDAPDWLGFFDVDELIVAKGGLGRFFAEEVPPEASTVLVRQRVMDSRWADGVAVPMREIGRQYGIVPFNPKMFVRPAHILPEELVRHPFHSVHRPVAEAFSGETWKADAARLCYHHFRGRPTYTLDATGGFPALERYERVTREAKPHPNFQHVRQFEPKASPPSPAGPTVRARIAGFLRRLGRRGQGRARSDP